MTTTNAVTRDQYPATDGPQFLERNYADCGEAMSDRGSDYLSGIYSLRVDEYAESQRVYCDPEGWTVIQSRGQFGNGVEHFYRDWNEYVQGFGTPGSVIILRKGIKM